jgi:predicted nucleotidyltransferase
VHLAGVPATSAELASRAGSTLESRAEVLEAYLFGSAARGEAQPHSDVDIAVYVDRELAPRGAYGYGAELTGDFAAFAEYVEHWLER